MGNLKTEHGFPFSNIYSYEGPVMGPLRETARTQMKSQRFTQDLSPPGPFPKKLPTGSKTHNMPLAMDIGKGKREEGVRTFCSCLLDQMLTVVQVLKRKKLKEDLQIRGIQNSE